MVILSMWHYICLNIDRLLMIKTSLFLNGQYILAWIAVWLEYLTSDAWEESSS
jgi:hypothetical protein